MIIYLLVIPVIILIFIFIYANSKAPIKYEKFLELLNLSEYEKLKELLRRVSQEKSGDISFNWIKFRLNMIENNYDYALVEIRIILKNLVIPKLVSEVEFFSLVFRCFKEEKRLVECLDSIIKYKDKIRNKYILHLYIGEIYFLEGNIPIAEKYISQVLDEFPNNSEALLMMGKIQVKNNPHKAQEYFEEAIKYSRRNYEAHYNLGLLHVKNNFYDKGIIEFEKSQLDKILKMDSIFMLGMCYEKKEMYINASEHYEKGIEIYEDKLIYSKYKKLIIEMRYRLAECYIQDKDFQSAIDQWREIQLVVPGYKDIDYKLKEHSRFGKDRVQDFLIASEFDFQKISKFLVELLGYKILKTKLLSKEEFDLIVDNNGNMLGITVNREHNPVGERRVKRFEERLVKYKLNKGIIICPVGVSPNALKYALKKPIEFVGKSQVMRLLKKYEVRGSS